MYTFKMTDLSNNNPPELFTVDSDNYDDAAEAATRIAADTWGCYESDVHAEFGLRGEFFDIDDFDAAAEALEDQDDWDYENDSDWGGYSGETYGYDYGDWN